MASRQEGRYSFVEGDGTCPMMPNDEFGVDKYHNVPHNWMPTCDLEPRCKEATRRPDWTIYFLGIARAVAARADCSRAQHGAVIVKDHRIVSTGYNGAPSGSEKSCLGGDCPRAHTNVKHLSPDYSNCIAIHAEANAIVYAKKSDMEGATIFITGAPCDGCEKLIAAAGIKEIVHA